MSNETFQQFGRVAVLAGGDSREREISLQSGNAVLAALKANAVDAELVDASHLDLNQLKTFDRAFIALHGSFGEDGRVQALLEFLNIPYTGSGVTASAIAMDKILSKRLWEYAGFPLAPSLIVKDQEEAMQAAENLGLPVIFKPSLEGSSVGITKVNSFDQVAKAYQAADLEYQEVLVEKFVIGEEYSVGILGEEVLPSVRFQTKREFYDYQAKYIDEDTEYFCPSGLSDKDEDKLRTLALAAFKELKCRGWGRVDFMRDQDGNFYILEVNTSPGMTSHSLVPIEAKTLGYSFEDLVIKILETTLDE